jgi:hypothetical protein
MADDVKVTNWPETGEAHAALSLFHYLRDGLPAKEGLPQIEQHLRLVRACRRAVQGYNFEMEGLS